MADGWRKTGGRLAGPGGGAGSRATLRGWPGPARRPRPLVPTGRFPRTNRRPPSADVGPVVSRFFSGSFLRRWHFAVSLTGAPGLCRAAPSDGRPGRSLSAPVAGRRWPHPRGPAPPGLPPSPGPRPQVRYPPPHTFRVNVQRAPRLGHLLISKVLQGFWSRTGSDPPGAQAAKSSSKGMAKSIGGSGGNGPCGSGPGQRHGHTCPSTSPPSTSRPVGAPAPAPFWGCILLCFLLLGGARLLLETRGPQSLAATSRLGGERGAGRGGRGGGGSRPQECDSLSLPGRVQLGHAPRVF